MKLKPPIKYDREAQIKHHKGMAAMMLSAWALWTVPAIIGVSLLKDTSYWVLIAWPPNCLLACFILAAPCMFKIIPEEEFKRQRIQMQQALRQPDEY